jgi:GTP-binding protein
LQLAAEFVTSAAGAGDFPRDRLPEVAVVGRSNVGKSSLINALARRPLARTSAAPGKTRLANFYRLKRGNAPALYLVDLPGYGYARGGDAAAVEFRTLIDAYFDRGHEDADAPGRSGKGTGVPIAVLLLVDARHPGLESDLEAWRWMRSHAASGRVVGTGVIGTKVDKLTRAERARHARELETLFDIPVPLVSARTGEGLEELWKLIARLPSRTAA